MKLLLPAAAILITAHAAFADPVAELASFSAFERADLERLASGKIMTARGKPMNYPRGLAVQSLFLVRLPAEQAADLLAEWSGAGHPQLEVFLHQIMGTPGPGDFGKIKSAPKNSSVRALVDATRKTNPERPQLHLSAEEAQRATQTRGDISGDVGNFWADVLRQRASAFAAGGISNQPPYLAGGERTSANAEATRLLKEHPNIRKQFSELTQRVLGGGKPQLLYWDMFDVEGQAAVALGAVYTQNTVDSFQVLDLQYYASSGHLVLLSYYQLWPIQIGGRPATLIWRGDIVSAPALASLKGVERLGSGTAMSKKIEQSISFFQKDASR